MTNEGIFTEAKLIDKVFKLQQLIKEKNNYIKIQDKEIDTCLLYTSPSPRDVEESRMPSSA